jgi:hypothetical protein
MNTEKTCRVGVLAHRFLATMGRPIEMVGEYTHPTLLQRDTGVPPVPNA